MSKKVFKLTLTTTTVAEMYVMAEDIEKAKEIAEDRWSDEKDEVVDTSVDGVEETPGDWEYVHEEVGSGRYGDIKQYQ